MGVIIQQIGQQSMIALLLRWKLPRTCPNMDTNQCSRNKLDIRRLFRRRKQDSSSDLLPRVGVFFDQFRNNLEHVQRAAHKFIRA